MTMTGSREIIDIALKNGASLAGIVKIDELRISPSHTLYKEIGGYSRMAGFLENTNLPDNKLTEGTGLLEWPEHVKSALVIAYHHPKDKPELDWWEGGGTQGNSILIDIIKKTAKEIEAKFNIKTRKLHYYVEKGGIFLKDAAALAGLGVIGKSNLFVSEKYGPRVRLRALFLEAEFDSTGPMDFDPCNDCKEFCRRACPENAMDKRNSIFESISFKGNLPGKDGFFDREICGNKLNKDDKEAVNAVVKYCRRCEFACPFGK